jgi:hypothetical protein
MSKGATKAKVVAGGGGAKATSAEVRALAGVYGPDALERLARLGGLLDREGGRVKLTGRPAYEAARSENAQVTALKELLDRAYGKASQPMEHSADEGLEEMLDRISRL